MVPLRRKMQMIFQDPYSSLNPRHTVGGIIGQPFQIQNVDSARRCQGRGPGPDGSRGAQPGALQPLPERVLRRAAAADRRGPRDRAEPEADRLPTNRSPPSTCRSRRRSSTCSRTSRTSSGMAYLFIAHDLSVVRHISDRVAVMYLGNLVEFTPLPTCSTHSRGTRTRVALLSAVPLPDPELRAQAASGSCSPATSRARSTRRRDASSVPAAGRRRRSARSRSRRWSRRPSGTRWPATSR